MLAEGLRKPPGRPTRGRPRFSHDPGEGSICLEPTCRPRMRLKKAGRCPNKAVRSQGF